MPLSAELNAAIESSAVVKRITRTAEASVVCGLLASVTRAVDGAGWRVASRIPVHDEAAERAAVDAVMNSGLARAVGKGSAGLGRAARASLALRFVTAAAGPFLALEIAQRVRLAGWMLLVAVVTRAAAARILEGSAPSGPAVIGWTVTLLVAAGLMTGHTAIASAWRHRRHAPAASSGEVLHI